MNGSTISDIGLTISALIVCGIALYAIYMWRQLTKEYDSLAYQWNDLVDNYNDLVEDRDFWLAAYEKANQNRDKKDTSTQDPWL